MKDKQGSTPVAANPSIPPLNNQRDNLRGDSGNFKLIDPLPLSISAFDLAHEHLPEIKHLSAADVFKASLFPTRFPAAIAQWPRSRPPKGNRGPGFED